MSKLKYFNGTNWVDANDSIAGDTLPIGSIIPYGTTTAPTGWLVCDGSTVSRATYSELFAIIGTSYGAGDGSTTFNLPNYKGKIPVGYNSSDSDFNSIGKTGGSKELQKHKHSVQFSNSYLGSGDTQVGNIIVSTVSGGVDTTETGSGTSGNLQPYQVSCYIIKVKQSAGLVANVSNTKTTSNKDTYSCNYINSLLLDMFYPVGSYYETSDGNFNPNTAWGGTWVEDSAGRATVSRGHPSANASDTFGAITSAQQQWTFTLGDTMGAYTHTLIASEIPSLAVNFTTSRPVPTQGGWYDGQYLGYGSNEDVASRNYSSKISTNAGGQAHYIMNPNVVVVRWHRTA